MRKDHCQEIEGPWNCYPKNIPYVHVDTSCVQVLFVICMDWKQKRGRPHSFQLKWMSSLPSSLARLWVNKEFIDYLILLFVFVSWVHDLVLLGIPDFGIWGVEGKVGHLHLSPPPSPTPFSSLSLPPPPSTHCTVGLGATWGWIGMYLQFT